MAFSNLNKPVIKELPKFTLPSQLSYVMKHLKRILKLTHGKKLNFLERQVTNTISVRLKLCIQNILNPAGL